MIAIGPEGCQRGRLWDNLSLQGTGIRRATRDSKPATRNLTPETRTPILEDVRTSVWRTMPGSCVVSG